METGKNLDIDLRRLEFLSTTNAADALQALGVNHFPYGIIPMNASPRKIIGKAVTVKLTAAGMTKSKSHIGVKAIDIAGKGDVIVIDNGGRLDTNCWGGILTAASKLKNIEGTVIDGACRDIEEYDAADYPVYARGRVVATARSRLIEEATNVMIQFHGAQVRPGDIVMADHSGVVFIPIEILNETIEKAETIFKKEQDMIADLKAGLSIVEVDNKYNYERMLESK
jgi:regulator of RNase E activity RraA